MVDKDDASDTPIDPLRCGVDGLVENTAREQRAFATPIEIIDVWAEKEEPRVEVIVVGWKIDCTAWMPLGPIQEATGLRPDELPGQWLEAEVNCYAEEVSDLFYRNITLASDPPQEWLTT